jgi:hypothetical protein
LLLLRRLEEQKAALTAFFCDKEEENAFLIHLNTTEPTFSAPLTGARELALVAVEHQNALAQLIECATLKHRLQTRLPQ